MERARFPGVICKRSEIKLTKEVFSTESKEQRQNLKQTQIITYMKGVAASTRPCSLP